MSKYRKQKHKEKESTTKQKPPSHDQNIVQQVGQSITPKPPETQNNSRPNEEDHPFWKWLKRAGIVAGIGYTIITWFMYCANRDAADAAKSAAKTADQAMHISERAYLFIDHPVFNLGMKSVFLPITNSGRIPSGRVEITTHYVVANLKSQTQPKVELKDSSEHRKAVLEYESISTGTPITTNQTLNTVDVKRVTAGVQRIYVVGYITYNDGFPETPIQKYTFCMDEGANRIRGDIEITSCDFATYMAMIDPLPEH